MLLLEGAAGLYLVDQHRAHERILYERMAATHGGRRPARAGRAARTAAAGAAPGPGRPLRPPPGRPGRPRFRLRASSAAAPSCSAPRPSCPACCRPTGADPLAGLGEPDGLLPTLLALSDDLAGEGEGWRDRLLVQLACRTAVRRGKPLDRPAMRALVEQLGQSRAPAVCPHGSPLLMHVGTDQLERQFGWR